MFICEGCDSIFPEPEVKTETEQYEYWGAGIAHKHRYEVCPFCGSYDIHEAPEEADED
jgi:hypothetical protein